ncbi:MAG: hypothetical protein GY730_06790 [bacterium]|nr:hypothetical protein [bacterium]
MIFRVAAYIAFVFLISARMSAAQPLDILEKDIDESSLFDTEIIVDVPDDSSDDLINIYTEKKSVNFTGQFRFDSLYLINRGWLQGKKRWGSNRIYNYTDGDLFLDVRLKKGIKAFFDIGIINTSSSISTSNTMTSAVDIKELFVDFNIDRKAYFRAGKQFLKWGRTYFWNPTDFVNVEKQNFLDMKYIRSGIYGVRAHFPVGMEQNLYMFLNTSNADDIDQFSIVTRFEFLAGRSEIGIIMWNKYKENSVFGADFSTNFMGLDLNGELAFSYGSIKERMIEKNNQLTKEKISGKWVPRATIGLSKTLNWERADRISLYYELFYNGEGYKQKYFGDNLKIDYLMQNNLYEMNYYAILYHSFFLSVNEFPFHSTDFKINSIQNLIDYSGILFTGLTYKVTEGFMVSTDLVLYFGDDNTEYLYDDSGAQLRMLAMIYF